MFQGNENKFKPDNEDFNSRNINAKCETKNIGKYIDTDPYSYVSDLIIQISKNITKGRGLSQAGVNALSLFILTGGLLYNYTVLPTTGVGLLKLYIVPILFLLYFLADMSKNISYINNLFMRIFKRSNFVYYAIINNSITLDDLEKFLQYKAFNSQQLIDIVEHLIKKTQFSPACQVSLMCNTALYDVESIDYIKSILLEFEFTTQAVCIFLERMEMRLDHNYLDKLIKKYGESQSVQFFMGIFHKNEINESSNLFYKLGYDFDYRKNPYDILVSLFNIVSVISILGVLWIIVKKLMLHSNWSDSFINWSDFFIDLDSAILIFGMLLFLSIGIECYLEFLRNQHYEKCVSKYLLGKKVDKNIIEDITSGFYF